MTLEEAMRNRHTVRRYTDRKLPGDVVEQLKERIGQNNRERGLAMSLVTENTEAFGPALRLFLAKGVRNYLVLAGKDYRDMKKKLQPIAAQLGILDILAKYPYEVSGGQKQRCAVARALITDPQIVLADEPTGALDSRASDNLLDLFGDINREGQTILMVTHSVKAASHAGRVLFLRDGQVYHQLYRGEQSAEAQFAKISDTLTVLTQGGEPRA